MHDVPASGAIALMSDNPYSSPGTVASLLIADCAKGVV